jgi:hypothetical protein
MAIAMAIASGKVGQADGHVDNKEVEASMNIYRYLASTSKSRYVVDAASLLVKGTTIVDSMRAFDEREDDEILRDLGKRVKKLPREDNYRFHMAFQLLCVGVGRASGGGFLKGPAFSSDEEAVVGEMHACLWGMTKPLKLPVPQEFIAFVHEAEAFVEIYGL